MGGVQLLGMVGWAEVVVPHGTPGCTITRIHMLLVNRLLVLLLLLLEIIGLLNLRLKTLRIVSARREIGTYVDIDVHVRAILHLVVGVAALVVVLLSLRILLSSFVLLLLIVVLLLPVVALGLSTFPLVVLALVLRLLLNWLLARMG